MRRREVVQALTRAERRALLVPFLAVTAAGRVEEASPALDQLRAELRDAGVDPAWSFDRFRTWAEVGR
jgi:hypothetical protein